MEMQKSGELQKHWDNFQAQEYTASMVSYWRPMYMIVDLHRRFLHMASIA